MGTPPSQPPDLKERRQKHLTATAVVNHAKQRGQKHLTGSSPKPTPKLSPSSSPKTRRNLIRQDRSTSTTGNLSSVIMEDDELTLAY